MPNTSEVKNRMRAVILPLANAVWEPMLASREFIADAKRYLTHSAGRDGAVTTRSRVSEIEAQLTKDYHRVEKGLTLLEPKRPFGAKVEARLEALLPELRRQDPMSPTVGHAESALQALKAWNSSGEIDDLVAPPGHRTKEFRNPANMEAFFQSRHSVRDFDASRLPSSDSIEKAALLAQTTPSVCNRQAGRLHVYTDPAQIQRVLAHQNGNAGFAQSVPAVAIVTVDARLFTGVHERQQRWIDGGLFAMTFVWALHGMGFQSCMLNWSRNNQDSSRLRKEAGVPENEDIIVLVAFGHASERHRTARSPKRALHEVLSIHESGI